jgi:hypothetical protein
MRYSGVADAVKRMWAAEGATGFFRGLTVKLYQTVLAAALMMMLKEVRLWVRCECVLCACECVACGVWVCVVGSGRRQLLKPPLRLKRPPQEIYEWTRAALLAPTGASVGGKKPAAMPARGGR